MRQFNLFESTWMTRTFGRPCRHPIGFFIYLELVRFWLLLLPLVIFELMLGYVWQRWLGSSGAEPVIAVICAIYLAFVGERLRWTFFHYNDNRSISLLWFLLMQVPLSALILFSLQQWAQVRHLHVPSLGLSDFLESAVLNWNELVDVGCSLLCAKFGREGERFRYPVFALAVVLEGLVYYAVHRGR